MDIKSGLSIFTFKNTTLVVILQSHDGISKRKWTAPEGGFKSLAYYVSHEKRLRNS